MENRLIKALRLIRLAAVAVVCMWGHVAGGIELGRLDPFGCVSPECDDPIDVYVNESGVINGWQQGPQWLEHPGGIERVTHGGPDGFGDHFLQVTSFRRLDGSNTPHTKVVVINRSAWTGDFIVAGVDEIVVDLKNLGGTATPTNPPDDGGLIFDHNTATDLNIRLEFDGGGARRIFSKVGVPLGVGSDWQNVTFSLKPEDLTGPPADGLSGIDLVNAVLQNTGVFRFFHSDVADEDVEANLGSVFPPTQGGFSGVLGIDNIYARLPGDFDLDVDEDRDDADALSLAIQSGSTNGRFDLSDDGVVDVTDGEQFLSDRLNTLAGDFNLDGQVDVRDLSVWATGFSRGDVFSQGDGDFNGQVDVADLSLWATGFGFSNATGAISMGSLEENAGAVAIPEPGSLGLLMGCAMMGLSCYRRTRRD